MRVLFIIILVLVGALLVLPYFFGKNAEKEYMMIEARIAESLQPGIVKITDQSYDRGWFSSKAETVYSITGTISEDDDGDGEEGEILSIKSQDTIYHGPVPIGPLLKAHIPVVPVLGVIESTAVLVPGPDSGLEQYIKGLPPILSKTVLGLSGGGVAQITVPGLQSADEDESAYASWTGIEGVIKFTPGFEEIDSTIESKMLSLKSDEVELTLEGLKGESDITYTDAGADVSLPLGTAVFNIESMNIMSLDEETGEIDELSIKNLNFDGSTEESAGALTSVHSLSFEEAKVSNLTYGPGGYNFALRNIDKTAWAEIQEILEEQRENGDETDEATQDDFLAKLMSILPLLVQKSPELEISDLHLETGQGDLKGGLFIAISGEGLEDPEMALNPLFLLAALSANAELSVTKTLLEDAMLGFNVEEIQDEISEGKLDELSEDEIQTLAAERSKFDINELTSQNVLVLEGDRYVMKAEYTTGQVLLNGNPLGLDALLGQ